MPILTGVRERRRKAGVKSGSFAPLAGYARNTLICIENGSRPASPEGAQRIADALTELGIETTVEDLLPQTVPDKPPKQPKGPKSPPKRQEKDPKGPRRTEGVAA